MTTFILGHGNCAFTVGFGQCPQRGAVLPFFAFGDSEKVAAELDMNASWEECQTEEQTRKTLDVFGRYGTVVFLDNYEATEQMFSMMLALLNHSTNTSWISREQMRETIQ